MLIEKKKSLVAASLDSMILLLNALFDASLKMPFRYFFFKGSIFCHLYYIREFVLAFILPMFNFLITLITLSGSIRTEVLFYFSVYPLYLAKFLVFGESYSNMCLMKDYWLSPQSIICGK